MEAECLAAERLKLELPAERKWQLCAGRWQLRAEAPACELEKKDTLTCAICLDNITWFSSACCLACVCEGVFHVECLRKVPKIDTHPEHGDLRICPYCRAKGFEISLEQALQAAHPQADVRSGAEAQIRKLTAACTEPQPRPLLLATEGRIRELRCRLDQVLSRVRGASETEFRQCLHPAETTRRPELAGSTLCQLCGAGVADFSDLFSQACECCALFHRGCLLKLAAEAPADRVPCCPQCSKVVVEAAGVSVKQDARFLSASNSEARAASWSAVETFWRRQTEIEARLQRNVAMASAALARTSTDRPKKRRCLHTH